MQNKKSTIAKLLAEEDISIVHKKTRTASFDVKKRELVLPIFKDQISNDVYDMFVCHEVGHSLWTPLDMLDKIKEQGIDKSVVNVIEDARIEREIRNTYPGLIAAMQRGYKELLKKDFFGDLEFIEWEETKLIDKINLKTKLGSMIDVPFNSEEKVFLDRAYANKTWDEVVQLAKDILIYTQENQDELLQPQEIPQVVQDLMDQIEEKEEQQEDILLVLWRSWW